MRSMILLAFLAALSLAPFGLTTALGWAGHLDALSGTTSPTLEDVGMAAAYVLTRLTALFVSPLLGLAALFSGILWGLCHLLFGDPRPAAAVDRVPPNPPIAVRGARQTPQP